MNCKYNGIKNDATMILEMRKRGATVKQIAVALGYAPTTIYNFFTKLHAEEKMQREIAAAQAAQEAAEAVESVAKEEAANEIAAAQAAAESRPEAVVEHDDTAAVAPAIINIPAGVYEIPIVLKVSTEYVKGVEIRA